jgi:hypothetical protein
MAVRQATRIPVLSHEETVKIMNDMDRLLDEMKETMDTIKKLIGNHNSKPGVSLREKVSTR